MDTLKVAAPYSLLFIGDPTQSVPGPVLAPVTIGREAVAVATLMFQDGPTTVRLRRRAGDGDAPTEGVVFAGELNLPSGRVAVSSAEAEVYWEVPIDGQRIAITITTNDLNEPDEVDIWYRPAAVPGDIRAH